ncbi:O-antigen ligase family protein [Rhodococcus sp. MS16]|nr:O-antigen ligase family protein [Rhodococcus sp. MS16]
MTDFYRTYSRRLVTNLPRVTSKSRIRENLLGLTLLGIVVAFFAGAGTAFSPLILAPVGALLLGMIYLVSTPIGTAKVLLGALVVLVLAPIPTVVPTSIWFAGGSVYFADVMAALLIVAVVFSNLCPAVIRTVVLTIAGVVVLGLLVGALSHAKASLALADARGLLRLVAGASGVAFLGEVDRAGTVKLLSRLAAVVTIWTALVVALIAFLGVSSFGIRNSNAAVYTTSQSIVYDASRVTPDSGLTCVVVSAVLIVIRLSWGYSPYKWNLVWWLCVGAGVFVGLISYTRGHFIVFLLIIGLSLMVQPGRLAAFSRAICVTAGVVLFSVFGYYLVSTFSSAMANSLTQPLIAFQGKVIGGLSLNTVEVDTSALWRVRESDLAIDFLENNWIFGSGFGAPYRQIVTGEIFQGSRGTTYIHSGYLWFLVKLGAMGSVVVAVILFQYFLMLWRSRNSEMGKWSALCMVVLFSIATQMVTSPTMIENGNSVLVGIILGSGYLVSIRSLSNRKSCSSANDLALSGRVEI